jgi:hypothetical protein
MNGAPKETRPVLGSALARAIGLHGRTAVLWGMAGGVGLGGVVVAMLTLGGRMSGHAMFAASTGLFVVGAVLGLIHGVTLGLLGRPAETTASEAARDLGRATLYAIPGLAVAWLVSVWVALTLIGYYAGTPGALAGVALGWLGAAAILGAAAVHGSRAIANAYARWSERRIGTLLVAGTFAALTMIFLADRPELWGIRLRLTETGAVLLAATLSIWVVGPLVTIALRLARQVPTVRVGAGLVRSRWTVGDIVVGIAAGLVVGLIAVPFMTPSPVPATAGALVVEVGQALVDEVLLRLFLVTAVGWVLLRWHRLRAAEAAVGAIALTAIVQTALYWPAALAVGFPAWSGTAAFIATAVILPAVVFGTLFWRRGFGTALVADATAVVAIGLLI